MANKRFSDTNPNHGDKDGKTPAKQPSGKAIPANPKSFSEPTHTRGGAPSKGGGKDLPAQKFTEQKHQQPSGDLPK